MLKNIINNLFKMAIILIEVQIKKLVVRFGSFERLLSSIGSRQFSVAGIGNREIIKTVRHCI